ncbi:LexA family protein [Effusibacillus consociatus]|uniref:LexA family protein n=1 Tax=Effusibacillus consociatus TaxID=1117041 RepID=A0ABV9Q3P9_9BACL
MNLKYYVPIAGEYYTKKAIPFYPEENYPLLKLSTMDLQDRFAVIIGDDGLQNWGVRPGDYLLFRRQGWPTEHGQLCFIHFGEEVILRIIPDLWNPEVDLVAANDDYPPISTHRNQFIVSGVCYGIKRQDDDLEILHTSDIF